MVLVPREKVMSQTKFFCFGPLQVERAGRDVEIGLNKAKALLAYLVVTAQAHSRDALASLFWPELDSHRARANLRRTLHRLTHTLGVGLFQNTDDTIRISSEATVWLDVQVFRQAMSACPERGTDPTPQDPNTLQSAVDLYHADFLAGFTLPDSPSFDEWQFFLREELRQTLARALLVLATATQQAGELEKAIHYTRRRLALDSLHEPAHRHLMQLYALAGQHAAALRQYDECVRILDQELGVPPDEETTTLFERIRTRQLTGTVASAPPTPVLKSAHEWRGIQVHRNLPVQTTPFIGRARELDLLESMMLDPAARLVTIVGPGGIGKTRLALAGADRVRTSFADGVCFVPLAPLSATEQLAPAIAESIGYRTFGGGEPETQLLGFLRDKQMLLVLDNFEHLMVGIQWVGELLQSAPTVKVLVTSRERLNQNGESIFLLDGLSYPKQMPPDTTLMQEDRLTADVMAHDAGRLFVQRVCLVRPALKLQTADFVHIAKICRLVQGMPPAGQNCFRLQKLLKKSHKTSTS
jgi:DNA-binding SARP family transcriptional activator